MRIGAVVMPADVGRDPAVNVGEAGERTLLRRVDRGAERQGGALCDAVCAHRLTQNGPFDQLRLTIGKLLPK